ncbi:aldo/keto reductase [Dongia sedimenti]|uniref:Aldo/keto reductase n=1 Tax=Dongia sedimenti TaxID=3064282 RepID=A0ABU0YJ57_9PROT|nr:aldo/keto reductase [Rhodospirillaceae bacterium R-7]
MELRELGRSGLKVSPVCLGGNVFGWTADEKASFAVLDDFTTAGGNFIDTADVYSTWVPGHKGGESETVLGKWLKTRGNRDKVIIATKVGSDMGNGRKGLKAGYIAQAVEDSLKRLQTDTIDLYQSHRDDLDTPQEETLEAYGKLVKAGKVRAIGASNFTAERLASALAISAKNGLPRYESLQPEYNLYERAGYEKELEPLCQKEKIGVIGYFGLASGFLTGKYRSEADLAKSPRGEDIGQYLNERGFRILKALDQVAAETKATQAQVAVAWLIARPSVTAPIVSATRIEQSHDLIKAMRLKLSSAQVEALNAASAY